MKKLAIALIVLALLIVFFSFVSIDRARFTEPPQQSDLGGDPPQVMLGALPPNGSGFELLTLVSGLAVAGCGIAQRKTRTKLANWHVFLGLTTALASSVLSIAIIDSPWITGDIFYLAYLTLILGFAVLVVGFLQLRRAKRSKLI
jgi:hypothetical protein